MKPNEIKKERLLHQKQIAKIKKRERDFSFYAGLMQPSYNSKKSTKHRTDEYVGFLNYRSDKYLVY